MAMGTRLGLLADRLGTTMRDGAKLTEEAAKKEGLNNSTGARVFNTIKDTLFTGAADEATGDTGATLTSRIAGGAIGVGAVAGAGVALQNIQNHPVLGTGVISAAALAVISTPHGVMEAAESIGSRFSHFANAGEAKDITQGKVLNKTSTLLGTSNRDAYQL